MKEVPSGSVGLRHRQAPYRASLPPSDLPACGAGAGRLLTGRRPCDVYGPGRIVSGGPSHTERAVGDRRSQFTISLASPADRTVS